MVSARGIRAGAAYVELTVENSKLLGGLKKAQAKLRAFSAGVRDVGAGLLKASAMAAAPLALSGRTFAGFADKMAEVRAVTGATGKDFKEMTSLAKELGRTTSFTAQQVAEGMTELGRAGYKPAQVLAAIPSVLNLARGTATELGTAAEIAAAAMRGFGLSAQDTTRIADVLTSTANNSAQTLEDVGEALKYVAPLAMEAGESLEDTAAAIGVMANNGIKGSMAGTALARAYKNLATAGAQKKLRELGIEAVDQAGNLRNVASILADLGERVQGMGSARRLAIFEELFGRGQAAALKLAAPGADFGDLQKTLKAASGTAERTAKTMDDTLGGSFRMLMSAAEGVQIAIGEAIEGTLRGWMDRAAALAQEITALVNANRGFIVSALKIAAVAGAVGAVLFATGTAGTVLAFTFGGLASILSGVSSVIGLVAGGIAALLTPMGLVSAAALALGAYILTSTDIGAKAITWLGDRFDELRDRVRKVVAGISDALAAGDVSLAAKIFWLSLKVEWQKGMNYLNLQWETLYVSAADALDRVAATAANVWDSVYAAALDALGKVETLVLQVGNAIATAFWDAIQKVMNGFATLADKVLTAGYALHLVDDKQLIQMDRALQAMREGVKATSDHSSTIYEKRVVEIEERRKTREQELSQGKSSREANLKERTNERDQTYVRDLIDAEKAVRSAQSEWESAVAEASQKRQAAAVSSPDSTEESNIGALVDQLRKAGAAAVDTVARVTEVRGTFNAEALLGLQGSGAEERTARAAEDTAKNTKRLVEEAALGGLTFG